MSDDKLKDLAKKLLIGVGAWFGIAIIISILFGSARGTEYQTVFYTFNVINFAFWFIFTIFRISRGSSSKDVDNSSVGKQPSADVEKISQEEIKERLLSPEIKALQAELNTLKVEEEKIKEEEEKAEDERLAQEEIARLKKEIEETKKRIKGDDDAYSNDYF